MVTKRLCLSCKCNVNLLQCSMNSTWRSLLPTRQLSNARNETIRYLGRGTRILETHVKTWITWRMVTILKLIRYGMKRLICFLQISTICWTHARLISFSRWMYLGLKMSGISKYTWGTAASAQYFWTSRCYRKAGKIRHRVLTKFRQNWLKRRSMNITVKAEYCTERVICGNPLLYTS